jgi:deoxycytidylate deaminase
MPGKWFFGCDTSNQTNSLSARHLCYSTSSQYCTYSSGVQYNRKGQEMLYLAPMLLRATGNSDAAGADTSQVYVAIADLWALRPTALQRYNTTVPRTILSRNALISTGYGDSLRKEERGSDRRKSRGIVQCLEESAITNPFLSSLPPTGAVQYQYCVLLYTF